MVSKKLSEKYVGVVKAMIIKVRGKFVVLSEKTGRRFGSYKTIAEAKKRLRQVEFFKHLAEKGQKIRKSK